MARTKTRAKQYSVGLSVKEIACVDAAATDAGISRSAWLRHHALRAAKYVRDRPAPLSASPPPRPSAKFTYRRSTFFTEEQLAALEEHARSCELALATYMREVLVGFKPAAHRPLARSAIVAVNRGVKELHELLQLADRGTLLPPDLMRTVTGLLAAFLTLRDALLAADAAASSAPEPTA
jgi:hypothetical protein